ncbi:MAG: helix-turn-helix transcriptional regulator [Planctomycetes bacterium]|nr:helix-turn-helix transcriptional regulator [Planctomycetota bacterium]
MLSVTRTWSFAHVTFARLPAHAPELFESVSAPCSIGVSLTGHARAEWEFDGRPKHGALAPGAVQVVADAPVRWRRVAERSACVEVAPAPELLAAWEGTRALAALAEQSPRRDMVALALALRLEQALSGARKLDDVELQTLVVALVERVLGVSRASGRALRLDAVLEQIEAQLHAPHPAASSLSLAQLAQVAGVSLHHFARRFRAQTGFSPHAYIQSRRMARAWEMLTRTSASVAEIALACGYESTSHFHAQFRRVHGRSPARARD